MSIEPLTTRQAQALRFIVQCIDSDGVAPSQAEIMAALGMKSKGGPSRLIDELVLRGYLARGAGRARSISIRRRLPNDLEGDSDAIAARLRRDARKQKGALRQGMLAAAKHYAAVASLVRSDRAKAPT